MKTNFATSLLALLSASLLLGPTAGCQRHAFSGPTPTPAAAPAVRQLQFGYGSRYSGHRTTYTLQADGVLLTQAGIGLRPGTPVAALRVGPAQARAALRRFDALPDDSLGFEQPGQHYYFLEGYTEAGQSVHLAWGAADTTAPHCARVLYRQLNGLLPANL
ncbi:hypothetical protein [Hymenobacter jeollabukensis]|uniref:Uncharacterized protein n=1 Tax=Hymenobacter jeollabukensis TaxID=2025313 RepID=A0A5R8WNS8_9BACT|nr:hypothetical protein [Hymenobacter jeollabukensis]TLM91689.1 hypothetical protein FDY95_14090 [Hymenobacter jeollabukensis]